MKELELKKLPAYRVDEYLYAGAKPYSLFEEDTHDMLSELKSIGITDIIDLREESEKREFLNINFTLHKIGFKDNSVPSIDILRKILNRINQLIENKKSIYIHCHQGLGRTGIVVASYLMNKNSIDGVSALNILRELKSNSKLCSYNSPITREQIEFVKKYKLE